MKILLSAAKNWVKAGRSKIYDDARKGLISTEKDPTRDNRKVVDVSELERVYGKIRNPDENPHVSNASLRRDYRLPSLNRAIAPRSASSAFA